MKMAIAAQWEQRQQQAHVHEWGSVSIPVTQFPSHWVPATA